MGHFLLSHLMSGINFWSATFAVTSFNRRHFIIVIPTISLSMISSLYHSRFKTYLFPQIIFTIDCFGSSHSHRTAWLHGLLTLHKSFFLFLCFYTSLNFRHVSAICGKRSWLSNTHQFVTLCMMGYPTVSCRIALSLMSDNDRYLRTQVRWNDSDSSSLIKSIISY